MNKLYPITSLGRFIAYQFHTELSFDRANPESRCEHTVSIPRRISFPHSRLEKSRGTGKKLLFVTEEFYDFPPLSQQIRHTRDPTVSQTLLFSQSTRDLRSVPPLASSSHPWNSNLPEIVPREDSTSTTARRVTFERGERKRKRRKKKKKDPPRYVTAQIEEPLFPFEKRSSPNFSRAGDSVVFDLRRTGATAFVSATFHRRLALCTWWKRDDKLLATRVAEHESENTWSIRREFRSSSFWRANETEEKARKWWNRESRFIRGAPSS